MLSSSIKQVMREEEKGGKAIEDEEVNATPTMSILHPHPPTYTITGTDGRHHDMMMLEI